jgi:hypothetical protein
MIKAAPVPCPAAVKLIRGLYARVGRDLGLDASYISRIARGERKSIVAEKAINREFNKALKLIGNCPTRLAKIESRRAAGRIERPNVLTFHQMSSLGWLRLRPLARLQLGGNLHIATTDLNCPFPRRESRLLESDCVISSGNHSGSANYIKRNRSNQVMSRKTALAILLVLSALYCLVELVLGRFAVSDEVFFKAAGRNWAATGRFAAPELKGYFSNVLVPPATEVFFAYRINRHPISAAGFEPGL